MFTIRITFEQEGKRPVTCYQTDACSSLLEICLKNNIELHHICGGNCTCTTCHLYINHGMEHLSIPSKRETDFITRAIHPENNSRLGCQSLLTGKHGEIRITIPDQRKISMQE